MSVWADNPEWFDEWVEKQALKGRFGPAKQAEAEAGPADRHRRRLHRSNDGVPREQPGIEVAFQQVHPL